MAVAVTMPSLGQTTDELLIVEWLKPEGAAVAEGEPLLLVQTDKATLEVESFAAGTLLTTLRRAGETVQAGTTIAWIGAPGEAIPPDSNSNSAPSSNRGSIAVGPPQPEDAAAGSSSSSSRKRLASPAARQLAREHGIDLERVNGSGPDGRVETRDVLRLINGEDPGP